MYAFDITRTSAINPGSFRATKVKADFDYQLAETTEHFAGEIILPETWNIGLIVGGSGTGKSTIANDLFAADIIKGFEYKNESVIDDMPRECLSGEIYKAFYDVGFGSVPSWLKPYSVLSNGEKMRVDLARALLEKDLIVFDEFTSVVDRDVAKHACIALHRAIKKTNKKFIAVTCHHDVIEYLQPDWIFDTDKMQMLDLFQYRLGRHNISRLENVAAANGTSLSVITI